MPRRFLLALLTLVLALPAAAADLAQARAALEQASGALADFSAPVTGWKFMLQAPEAAAQPAFDDSAWKPIAAGDEWQEEHTWGWYRSRLVVPEKVRGLPTRGQPLILLVGVDDAGELYVDGKLRQKFEWNDGRVVLAEAAVPGTTYTLALKAINEGDEGTLHFANLLVPASEALAAQRDAFLDAARQAAQYCSHSTAPDPACLEAIVAACGEVVAARDNLPALPALLNRARERLQPVFASMTQTPIFLAPPYLQNVTTEGITVMWETAGEWAGYVEYKESAYAPASRVEQATASLGRVRLAGLRPGTAYMYRVVLGGVEGPWHTFRTAPAGGGNVRFAVWGDAQDGPVLFEQIIGHVFRFRPDLCWSTGDMVGRGSNLTQWVDQRLWPIRQLAAEIPTYAAIGNHEFGGFPDGPDRRCPPYEKYFEHPAGSGSKYWFSVDYGPAHFIALRPDPSLLPGGKQYQWLEQDLAQAQTRARWIFLFFHQPPYSECWSGGYYDGELELRQYLVPLLERYGADIVFSGHTHDYERGLPHPPYDPATGSGNTVTYIINGGGGCYHDNHKYREWPQIDIPDHPANPNSDAQDEGKYYVSHFIIVDIAGDTLQFTAYKVEDDGTFGGVLDQFTLQARKR